MMKLLPLLLFLSLSTSCQKSSQTKTENTELKVTKDIEKRLFGKMPNGEEVFEYTLRNSDKMEVSVITYGGIIKTLLVPGKKGQLTDVVLGHDNLQEYIENNPYFGAIVGRYGNRIAKGRFSLDDKTYQLATNNLGNHLHGGIVGFDKVLWHAEVVQRGAEMVLKMTYLSKDMEEGYPGNLEVTVIYQLTEENEMVIEYSAKTDKKTIVNLTSHSYFNLSDNSSDILSHQLQINATQYLPVDPTLIPLELAPVASTPFDFRSLKVIGVDIDLEDDQLKNGSGFDHCWVLDESEEPMNLAATLYEPTSGRVMEVYTEEPGIQFYSGNFLDGSIEGKYGKAYERRSGLCLETQHYPDSPNRPDFPSTVLNAGEVYGTKTIYKFSVK